MQGTNASIFTAFAFKEFMSASSSASYTVKLDSDGSLRALHVSSGRPEPVNISISDIPSDWDTSDGAPWTISDETNTVSISLFVTTTNNVRRVSMVSLTFTSGFSFSISILSISEKALNILSSADISASTKGYTGLFGKYDNITTNDLEGQDLVVTAPDANLEVIHNAFGMTWLTKEVETVFVYDEGETHSDFPDTDFTPSFVEVNIDDVPEVIADLCGDSKACRFDYVSSGGDYSFAEGTKEFVEEFEEVKEAHDLVLIFCPELTPPENGYYTVPNFLNGSIATFSCDGSYILDGSEELVCNDSGAWSGSEPKCVFKDRDIIVGGGIVPVSSSLLIILSIGVLPRLLLL